MRHQMRTEIVSCFNRLRYPSPAERLRPVWETWDRTFKQFLVAFEQQYSRTIISQEAMLKT